MGEQESTGHFAHHGMDGVAALRKSLTVAFQSFHNLERLWKRLLSARKDKCAMVHGQV